MRAHLVERVGKTTGKPVEHIVHADAPSAVA
jgi:hypothetical protein